MTYTPMPIMPIQSSEDWQLLGEEIFAVARSHIDLTRNPAALSVQPALVRIPVEVDVGELYQFPRLAMQRAARELREALQDVPGLRKEHLQHGCSVEGYNRFDAGTVTKGWVYCIDMQAEQPAPDDSHATQIMKHAQRLDLPHDGPSLETACAALHAYACLVDRLTNQQRGEMTVGYDDPSGDDV